MKDQKDKNKMENPKDVKAKDAPQMNTVKKPNDPLPTLNDDNDPSTNWHLESGDKLNEYGK